MNSIEANAFSSCSSLANITINRADESELTIAKNAFQACGTNSITLGYNGDSSYDYIFDITQNCGYTIAQNNTNAYVLNLTNSSKETSEAVLKLQYKTPYTVTFNPNNGSASGTMEAQTFYRFTYQNLTSNSFSLVGYKFTGWNTKADGTGNSYDDGASVSFDCEANGNIDLYAQWTPLLNYAIDGSTAYVAQNSNATGDITILSEITVDGTTYPVTRIADGAFSGCTEISSVSIPVSVTTIGANAFSGCTLLSSASVTFTLNKTLAIGQNAFYNTAVSSVSIRYTGEIAMSHLVKYEITDNCGYSVDNLFSSLLSNKRTIFVNVNS